MNHQTNRIQLQALAAIVICCATTSLGIAVLAVCLLRGLSDSAMWAVAAMVAAPSVMGIAVADFITRRWTTDATLAGSSLHRAPGAPRAG